MSDAEPVPVPVHCRDDLRRRLRRHVRARAFRAAQAARDQRVDTARQILQEPLGPVPMIRATARARKPAAGRSDEALVALYLDMLAAERGASVNTLAAYGRDLADFAAYLAGRRLTPATVARRLSAIRQLYRFLYAEGRRKDDPAAVLEGPKRSRPLPKT